MTSSYDRVVHVVGDGTDRRGSGYLVAPGIVLTASHVVAGARAIRLVGGPGADDEWRASAEVVFTSGDVALLATDGGDPAIVAARLAAVDRDGEGFEATATGFPLWRMQNRDGTIPRADDGRDKVRDSHHAVGFVFPTSGMRTATLEMIVRARPSATVGFRPGESPWSGMSGAAIWRDDRIVGVVGRHYPDHGPSTLTGVPLDSILVDDRLDDLAGHLGDDTALDLLDTGHTAALAADTTPPAGPGGLWGTTADRWSAVELGVRPALTVDETVPDDPHDALALPTYLRRRHDDELDRRVADSAGVPTLVVLVGGASAGTSRALHEVVRRRATTCPLAHPLASGPWRTLTELEPARLPAERCVLHLGDLADHVLGEDGEAAAGQLLRLLGSRRDVLVIASMWPSVWDEAVTAAGGRQPNLRRLLLAYASRVDVVEDGFLAGERERGLADPRLAPALAAGDGFTQFLTAAPALINHYDTAASDRPALRALLTAAVDLTRHTGLTRLDPEFLLDAAVAYMDDATWRSLTQQTWRRDLLDEATTPLRGRGSVSPMSLEHPRPPETGPVQIGVAPFLVYRVGARRAGEPIPRAVFDAALARAAELNRPVPVAAVARRQGYDDLAIGILGVHARAGSAIACAPLLELLTDTGRLAEHADLLGDALGALRLTHPVMVGRIVDRLRSCGQPVRARELAVRAADQAPVNNCYETVYLLRALRRAGFTEEERSLGMRAAVACRRDQIDAAAFLLGALAAAADPTAARIVVARMTRVPHSENPASVAQLADTLRRADFLAEAAAVAVRGVRTVDTGRGVGVVHLLSVLGRLHEREAAAELAQRCLVNPVLPATASSARVVSALRHHGLLDGARRLAELAGPVMPVTATLETAKVIDFLVSARSPVAGVLAERAAREAPVSKLRQAASLVRSLGRLDDPAPLRRYLERVAEHAPVGQTTFLATLIRRLHEVGADDVIDRLVTRRQSRVRFWALHSTAHLLDVLVAVGRTTAACDFARSALDGGLETNPASLGYFLDVCRRHGLLALSGPELAAAASRVALGNPHGVASLIQQLNAARASEVALALANRAAAATAVGNPNSLALLLGAMTGTDALEARALLVERAASAAVLDNPLSVSHLIRALATVGAVEAIHSIAERSVWTVELVRMKGLAQLLSALEAVGEGDARDLLACRIVEGTPTPCGPGGELLLNSLLDAGLVTEADQFLARAMADPHPRDLEAICRIGTVAAARGRGEVIGAALSGLLGGLGSGGDENGASPRPVTRWQVRAITVLRGTGRFTDGARLASVLARDVLLGDLSVVSELGRAIEGLTGDGPAMLLRERLEAAVAAHDPGLGQALELASPDAVTRWLAALNGIGLGPVAEKVISARMCRDRLWQSGPVARLVSMLDGRHLAATRDGLIARAVDELATPPGTADLVVLLGQLSDAAEQTRGLLIVHWLTEPRTPAAYGEVLDFVRMMGWTRAQRDLAAQVPARVDLAGVAGLADLVTVLLECGEDERATALVSAATAGAVLTGLDDVAALVEACTRVGSHDLAAAAAARAPAVVAPSASLRLRDVVRHWDTPGLEAMTEGLVRAALAATPEHGDLAAVVVWLDARGRLAELIDEITTCVTRLVPAGTEGVLVLVRALRRTGMDAAAALVAVTPDVPIDNANHTAALIDELLALDLVGPAARLAERAAAEAPLGSANFGIYLARRVAKAVHVEHAATDDPAGEREPSAALDTLVGRMLATSLFGGTPELASMIELLGDLARPADARDLVDATVGRADATDLHGVGVLIGVLGRHGFTAEADALATRALGAIALTNALAVTGFCGHLVSLGRDADARDTAERAALQVRLTNVVELASFLEHCRVHGVMTVFRVCIQRWENDPPAVVNSPVSDLFGVVVAALGYLEGRAWVARLAAVSRIDDPAVAVRLARGLLGLGLTQDAATLAARALRLPAPTDTAAVTELLGVARDVGLESDARVAARRWAGVVDLDDVAAVTRMLQCLRQARWREAATRLVRRVAIRAAVCPPRASALLLRKLHLMGFDHEARLYASRLVAEAQSFGPADVRAVRDVLVRIGSVAAAAGLAAGPAGRSSSGSDEQTSPDVSDAPSQGDPAPLGVTEPVCGS